MLNSFAARRLPFTACERTTPIDHIDRATAGSAVHARSTRTHASKPISMAPTWRSRSNGKRAMSSVSGTASTAYHGVIQPCCAVSAAETAKMHRAERQHGSVEHAARRALRSAAGSTAGSTAGDVAPRR